MWWVGENESRDAHPWGAHVNRIRKEILRVSKVIVAILRQGGADFNV